MNLVPSGSQMPERSGLPSAVFGAGAARSTLPSAGRGRPGVLKSIHCADAGAARNTPSERVTSTAHFVIADLHISRRLYCRWPGSVRLSADATCGLRELPSHELA